MQPTIITLAHKKLIGQRVTMSFAQDRTVELWQGFMPRRGEIANKVNNDLVSMQMYGADFEFNRFDPTKPFDKWAAVEVTELGSVPDGMDTFDLVGGLYAVFPYKGAPQAASPFFQNIFTLWLPQTGYKPDNSRPHFELLDHRYRNNHPESEEDIYVPVGR